jgi:hypothetical protein
VRPWDWETVRNVRAGTGEGATEGDRSSSQGARGESRLREARGRSCGGASRGDAAPLPGHATLAAFNVLGSINFQQLKN